MSTSEESKAELEQLKRDLRDAALSQFGRATNAEAERDQALKERAILVEALRRIAKAKPDRMDHSIDVGIIERSTVIARAALHQIGEGVTEPAPGKVTK